MCADLATSVIPSVYCGAGCLQLSVQLTVQLTVPPRCCSLLCSVMVTSQGTSQVTLAQLPVVLEKPSAMMVPMTCPQPSVQSLSLSK